MDALDQLPGKPEVIRFLLETEGRVMLCVDATLEGVDVPRRFQRDRELRLVLNVRMPQPIYVQPDHIESELRFGGVPHHCIVPLTAVWGAYNPDTGHGVFWPDSMPDIIRFRYEQAAMEQGLLSMEAVFTTPTNPLKEGEVIPLHAPIKPPTVPASPSAPPVAQGRPQLRVIEGGPPTEGEESPPATPPSRPPRRARPKLKLVE